MLDKYEAASTSSPSYSWPSGPSHVNSSAEDDSLEDFVSATKYKLSLEDVEDLLKAIYETLYIQEDKVQLSRHDLMYQSMEQKKVCCFLVHNVLSTAVL